MTVTFLIVLSVTSNFMPSHAAEFLKPGSAQLRVSEEDIRVSLLDEVENSLGKSTASSRVTKIEAALRPIVAALPKNAHGNLEKSTVNYALHRLFVLRHGWVINGLGAGAETVADNSSSSVGVLKDRVPAYIEGLFEKQLAGKGFGLREVATLAATIEHLVHNEAVSKLGTAFNVLEQSVTSTLSSEEVTEVLDTYMMTYVLGQSLSNNANLTKKLARRLIKSMPKIHLGWNDTQKYVDGIRQNIITDEAEGANFASVAKIIQTVGEEYGTFQDKECQQMMDTLMTMEYRGTGRVMLSDFYKPALEGAWTFKENMST